MAKHKVWRLGVLFVFLYGGITWAQVTTGTISGTVKDSSGSVLPGANVVIVNDDTGISRAVQTDSSGHYSVLSLSSGNYRATATMTGFETEVRSGILLTVAREEVVDFSLAVGSTQQTVQVTAGAPLVEATTAGLGSLVDDKTIRELPLNGRSWNQLALLQPGVTTSTPNTNTATIFGNGSGERFSSGGQRQNSNLFLLDGTNINDAANGTPGGAAGNDLGVETIREFKILTNSNKAEFGHSTGAVVTAITRSGTNTLHGTAFYYIRNSVLDSPNYFDVGSTPPFKRNQFGGVLGGPIKKDKTFFFVGYEGLRQGQETTQVATVPTALARQGILPTQTVPVNPDVVPFLNLYPLPNGPDFGDGTAQFLSAPNGITGEDYGMVRVDHQLNAKTSIFARYEIDNDQVNQPASLPDQLTIFAARRQYLTIQETSVFSAATLNSARFAFNRSFELIDDLVVPEPGITLIPGEGFGGIQVGGSAGAGPRAITPLGTPTGNGLYRWPFNVFEWGDDVTHIVGKHTLKFGADIQRLQSNATSGDKAKGVYTFASLTTFLAGTPTNLQALGPVGVQQEAGMRQTLFAFYGQDDYKVNSRVTLNLGLRWEAPTDPTEVNGKTAILPSISSPTLVLSDHLLTITKKNFEPRIGIAWQLDSSGLTVLRIGAGIFHQQILPWSYTNQTKIPPFSGLFSITNPPFPNGYEELPTGSPSATGNGKTSLQIMNPFEKTPTDYQYNVSIQRQIGKDTVLEIAYAGNHANHLMTEAEADTNVPTFLPDGQPFFTGPPRENPAWNGIRYYSMNTNSDYNSVTIMARRQLSRGFQGQIFYTYSKALDEASGISNAETGNSLQGIQNPLDPKADWGPSDFNATHDVVGNFSYALPFRTESRAIGLIVNGWTVDGIGTFTSGHPFTAALSSSVSRNGAVALAERPDLIPGRNPNPIHGVSVGCPGFTAGTPVGNAQHWYDPCSFALPTLGTYGDLRRNTLTAPGLQSVDVALEKNFELNERTSLTFRTEAFNIMNHTNFGIPNPAPLAASGAPNGSAGVILTTTTSSRQLQFALRLNF
jgi:Carboxypeptidase regulatory-like domain